MALITSVLIDFFHGIKKLMPTLTLLFQILSAHIYTGSNSYSNMVSHSNQPKIEHNKCMLQIFLINMKNYSKLYFSAIS